MLRLGDYNDYLAAIAEAAPPAPAPAPPRRAKPAAAAARGPPGRQRASGGRRSARSG